MRNYRTRKGAFRERPYYTNEEIERTCTEELRAVGLYPSEPQPIRIDRFIEKRFGISHEYDHLPPGILGYTRFGKTGVKGVVVARSLDDNSTVNERRIRSTLAHEGGHGLFHAHLFVLTGQSSLFPEGESAQPRVLCRDDRQESEERKYRGEWWEYQANRAIGGLLLPRQLALKALEPFVVATGLLGFTTLPEENRAAAVEHLSEVFDVNGAVASIRLAELFPASGEQQML